MNYPQIIHEYNFLVFENTKSIDEYLRLYGESLTSENLIFE